MTKELSWYWYFIFMKLWSWPIGPIKKDIYIYIYIYIYICFNVVSDCFFIMERFWIKRSEGAVFMLKFTQLRFNLNKR